MQVLNAMASALMPAESPFQTLPVLVFISCTYIQPVREEQAHAGGTLSGKRADQESFRTFTFAVRVSTAFRILNF
jgi:hypothetical protein